MAKRFLLQKWSGPSLCKSGRVYPCKSGRAYPCKIGRMPPFVKVVGHFSKSWVRSDFLLAHPGTLLTTLGQAKLGRGSSAEGISAGVSGKYFRRGS
ncbi:hypothetical protein Pyn_29188 [Prunus yedoensis var. nudiflora]|uniref:Uncharacterized protein n=1 Tax=Prunus yedoensis var. nudiflora TaxID=2094558 RepID=A0A314XIL0_PRUYE|nr:hypothetical protein Pyn_29188 [Prunus yedoensis var. nudiflora]